MSKSVKTITYEGKELARIFRSGLEVEGTKFLTPEDYTLQLGLLEHDAGKKIKEHMHNPELKYQVDTTQEFLYIVSGKVKVKYYSEDWQKVAEEILTPGDFLLHISGAHGFEILEKARMIEVKQGPYPGDRKAKLYKKEE